MAQINAPNYAIPDNSQQQIHFVANLYMKHIFHPYTKCSNSVSGS